MEQQSCKYHPRKSPHWHCETCDIYFCGDCIPGSRQNYYKFTPKCVLCHGGVNYLGGAHGADPFWKAASNFFLYPLKPNGLLIMAMLIGAIYFSLTLSGFTLVLVARVGILACITAYIMLIIEESSQGKDSPPVIRGFFDIELNIFLKVMVVFVALGVAEHFIRLESGLLALIFKIFASLYIPVFLMLLAISKTLLTAINPMVQMSFIYRIGTPYLLLVICLNFVTEGPVYIGLFLLEYFELWVVQAVSVVTLVYFLFVVARMMGYTVYQYQGVLGYASDDDDKYFLPVDELARKSLLGKAHILIQEGRYDEAFKALRTALVEDKENLEYHEYVHKLLLATNSLEGLETHANEVTSLLVDKGLVFKAANHYLDALNKGAKFIYEDSENCYQVADALSQQSKYKVALQLLNGLHKRDPRYARLFDAYFLAAKILIENLSNDAKGGQLIDFILQKFPKHERFEEVQKYKRSLLA